MAKRPAETLDDLLAPALRGATLTDWCSSHEIDPRTVWRLRNGRVAKPHLGTLSLLAAAMKVDVARVRAACEASRDAAAKG